MIGTKARWLVVALAVSWSSPAPAIMATEPTSLEKADDAAYNQLKSVIDDPGFVGSIGDVYAARVGAPDGKFLLARMENSACNGEFCPTAIISDSGDQSRMIALGWLPKRFLLSDVWQRPCKSCGTVIGLFFVDTAGTVTVLGVSPGYVFVQRTVAGDAK